MEHDADKYWQQVSPGLRRYLNLAPPTRAEAEAEFEAAEAVPISEERMQSILNYATTGKREKRRKKMELPDWLKNIDLTQIGQDMVPALARNAGKTDVEVTRLLEELRKEHLADDDDEGEYGRE
ncbi:MAG: hypothetical protein L3K26_00060 [Candidatus Hydrogenedentes bacterium]|nr:hypothetical protein [Candidatus Hydrogenedentota bacterium]